MPAELDFIASGMMGFMGRETTSEEREREREQRKEEAVKTSLEMSRPKNISYAR